MSSSHLIEARARVEELVNKCGDEEEKETALINSPPQTVADKIQIMPSLSDRSSEAEWQMANMQAIQEFVSLVKDQAWKFQGTENNIRIYKNKTPSNAPFPSFLGVGDLAVPPMSVLELVSHSEQKSEYDEIFDSARVLHQFDEYSQVEGWSFWTPSRIIVAARDFVLLAHGARLGDGSLCIIAKSIKFENNSNNNLSGGERKGFLRGNVITGGFLVQPLIDQPYNFSDETRPIEHFTPIGLNDLTVLSARRCRVLYLAQVDLKGSLPRQLQTQLFQRQPQQIHQMRRILEKDTFDHKFALYKQKIENMPVYKNIKIIE